MAQAEQFDINNLLDGTLDDLEDLPSFKPYPVGLHRVTTNFEQKVVNKHPSIELKFKMQETIQLADSTDTPPVAGDVANLLYTLDNEFARGKFKMVMQAAAAKFGSKSNRELIQDCQNATAQIVTRLRPNKADPDAPYMDLVEIAFD